MANTRLSALALVLPSLLVVATFSPLSAQLTSAGPPDAARPQQLGPEPLAPVTDFSFTPLSAPHPLCTLVASCGTGGFRIQCSPTSVITTQYTGFGVDFTSQGGLPNVGIFEDSATPGTGPQAFAGINADGCIEVAGADGGVEVNGYIVLPGTTTPATTDLIAVCMGILDGGASAGLLEAFDSSGTLVDSSQADDGTGTGCLEAVVNRNGISDIARFRVSGTDPAGWGIRQIHLNRPPPDLVVSSLTHSPASPTTNDSIQFTAVVKNVGGDTAGVSKLMFAIGGETPGALNTLFDVPALGPGQTHTVTRSMKTLDAGSYQNTATADYNQQVAESNEGNNTTIDLYTVTEVAPPAPLIYQLVSLPTKGTIQGVTGPCTPESPCNLASSQLVYVPDEGETGGDQFDYRVFNPNTNLFSVAARISVLIRDLLGTGLSLTVNIVGNGEVSLDKAGSVVAICSSSPCVNSFAPNDIIKLQARPLDLSTFVNWTIDCSGTSQIFTLNMGSTSKECTATFSP